MKKIGIITYHFARNYGAVLQCFALQTYLKNLGYQVEIINYINENQLYNNDYFKHGKNIKSFIINLLLIPFLNKRKKKNFKFDEFNKKYLNLSKKVKNLRELEELCKMQKYDFIISGSDQVFNPNIEDFDLSFLIPFKTSSNVISYAASTGNATEKDLESIKKYLENFDSISIREKKDIVKFKNILKKPISVVPDPVILITKDEWEKYISKNSNEKYLVCYFLHKNIMKREYNIARKIAKDKKLKLVIINARFNWMSLKRNCILDAGPLEFINLIYNSSYVCTDSFHGTLFALIFNKNVSCFDSKENKNDSRRKNLLEELKCSNAMCYVEDCLQESKMNYDVINQKIIDKRIEGKAFLGVIDEK